MQLHPRMRVYHCTRSNTPINLRRHVEKTCQINGVHPETMNVEDIADDVKEFFLSYTQEYY